jgi:hypothetical protein
MDLRDLREIPSQLLSRYRADEWSPWKASLKMFFMSEFAFNS